MTPISLYIHIPWCIRKCPYCDFNSHKSPEILPEIAYVDALLADLRADLALYAGSELILQSIFIGGGTPSLFSAQAFERLLTQIQTYMLFDAQIEITLEANPGTVEHGRFSDYFALGINRISLGIQSFHNHHLQRLGRIHDGKQAHQAIEQVQQAGFSNFNLDLMHGLPEQSVQEALDDIQQAFQHNPSHLSWYQLTIEPNTLFHKTQPSLPEEHIMADIEEKGMLLLQAQGYERYEISAFCRNQQKSLHNMNYWLFGDYFGIGAGAHGKLTSQAPHTIYRTQKHRQPKEYLNPQKPFLAQKHRLDTPALIFEFMLNTTRLEQAVAYHLFEERTGLSVELLMPHLKKAQTLGLLDLQSHSWQVSPLGRRFTNDLQSLFLF
ncbi:MAG TPA: radical SAM family heme chaperone HemW [Legionellaceae bacterium]|nr:radical SAM family heme chaperone HemW [Legionellaceae bacterium]